MGTKCFHDIQVVDSQQVTNSPKNSPVSKKSDRNSLSSRHTKNSQSNGNMARKVAKQKNIVVNHENEDLSEGYEKSVLKIVQKHNRNADDEPLIEQCLLRHFFMRSLERQARLEIIKEMSLCYVKEESYIFKQGGIGCYFYILKKGKIETFSSNDRASRIINVGESFGEIALLHGAPRLTNARCLTDCYLWVLERKNFKKIVDHITKMNFEESKNFVESIPILANIDHAQKAVLCSSLYKESFDEGNYIVKKGEEAHCLYIVKEGEVNCSLNGKIVRTLKKGDNFGERSILVDSTRSLDVIAKTNCVCYSISTNTLKTMLGDNFRTLLYLNFIKSSFTRSKNFSKFNVKLLDNALNIFQAINLGKNDIAMKEGYEKSSKLVVVIDGSLMNIKTKEIVANRGDILFESDLFNNSKEKTTYDIIPHPDCLLIQADMDKFTKCLGGSFTKLINQKSIIDSLLKVQIFRNLTSKKLEHLAEIIGVENYENGTNIITQGEEGNKFYIVKSGKVDIFVGKKYIRTLNEKECFGERALFFHEKRSATIKAVGNVSVFFISQKDFMSIIEGNMKEHLMNRLYLQDNTVELKDLLFCASLGSGNYGKVALVKNLKNNFFYAIKIISRKQIDCEQLHSNLELERNILLQIDHPFIVKLVKTLKDKKYIYFLMEYIKGRELFDVIRDIGLLNKEQTQFYGASLMLAVDYLHERKFVYRDIKPENIIVIQSGYVKLIDFGTAKAIVDRTNTIIGTPHYMAPEVVLGEGYSFQVDMWSIAICLYEFMCGGVPFGENAEDPMDVYLSIINDKMSFPPFCKDQEFKLLMQQMLTKNAMSRMSKLSQVQSHIWFKDFNWDDLISLKMTPPYKPQLQVDDIKEPKPFVEYVEKNVTDWTTDKDKMEIDEKNRKIYDDWFKKF